MVLEKPAEILNHCEQFSTELHLVFTILTCTKLKNISDLFFPDHGQIAVLFVLINFLISWTLLCILHCVTLLSYFTRVFQMVTSVKMKSVMVLHSLDFYECPSLKGISYKPCLILVVFNFT